MVKDNLYEEKDYVDVVDEHGVPLEAPVPKSWIGTDLLPPGAKKAGKADKADDVVEVPEGAPTADWTVPQLTAYAARESIELGDAKKKDDIVKIVVPAPPTE